MQNARPIACITGATSGIGRCFAIRLAEKGYDLVVTGRRGGLLRALSGRLNSSCGVKVRLIIGDLSEAPFRERIVQFLKSEPGIEVLVNNAGFGVDTDFCNITPGQVRSMVQTHVDATVEFSHAVLPAMKEKRRGIIINVSSLGAFIPGITRCLYMSTKSFMHAFSVGLSMEMAPYGIKVQSLCPGMTRTDFHRHNTGAETRRQMKKIRFMDPFEVVDTSLRQLSRNGILCIPGPVNHLFYLLARALPKRFLSRLASFRSEREKENPGTGSGERQFPTRTRFASDRAEPVNLALHDNASLSGVFGLKPAWLKSPYPSNCLLNLK